MSMRSACRSPRARRRTASEPGTSAGSTRAGTSACATWWCWNTSPIPSTRRWELQSASTSGKAPAGSCGRVARPTWLSIESAGWRGCPVPCARAILWELADAGLLRATPPFLPCWSTFWLEPVGPPPPPVVGDARELAPVAAPPVGSIRQQQPACSEQERVHVGLEANERRELGKLDRAAEAVAGDDQHAG